MVLERTMLSWDQQTQLAEQVPATLTTAAGDPSPSTTTRPPDGVGPGADMFGTRTHPTIANGVPLTIELLSPADRPDPDHQRPSRVLVGFVGAGPQGPRRPIPETSVAGRPGVRSAAAPEGSAHRTDWHSTGITMRRIVVFLADHSQRRTTWQRRKQRRRQRSISQEGTSKEEAQLAKKASAQRKSTKFDSFICNVVPSKGTENDWQLIDSIQAGTIGAPAALPKSVDLRACMVDDQQPGEHRLMRRLGHR